MTLEGGAHAALGGVQIRALHGAGGQFTADGLRRALRRPDRRQARQALISVEQTTNLGGGTIWEESELDAVVDIARAAGLATHMDGARLLNACVVTGLSPRQMVAGWDSVWIDFSKGLCAPLGAALAGSRRFVDQVWRWKLRLGGSLRHAGICAAACHYALDHNVGRLADDHANSWTLADGLSAIPGIVVQALQSNLVFFNASGAGLSNERMETAVRQHGVMISIMGGRLRACTYLDVSAAMVQGNIGDLRRGLSQSGRWRIEAARVFRAWPDRWSSSSAHGAGADHRGVGSLDQRQRAAIAHIGARQHYFVGAGISDLDQRCADRIRQRRLPGGAEHDR
ncbi:threonine aldolase [Rhodopseudomonas rhenobacensis]|uniref:Threonine aldolase n=1 Tax=Rhodopseudomonas rhenobacensis TaxID=87461 RepID=A0A7W7Z2P0_9BRAD|nr:threonine aldolase [Rhodopseudomonas rhenobacensis]